MSDDKRTADFGRGRRDAEFDQIRTDNRRHHDDMKGVEGRLSEVERQLDRIEDQIKALQRRFEQIERRSDAEMQRIKGHFDRGGIIESIEVRLSSIERVDFAKLASSVEVLATSVQRLESERERWPWLWKVLTAALATYIALQNAGVIP